MTIIGTAGHVDHGKSTLVRALTGIDPDRLAEEKRRGMTIDLGFAHLDLPSGQRIGIVDVPGHARFLHNMLAGVHGMDGVVLVVAADEGVMAQTLEHLDILELLEVRRLVVALAKMDLVDPEWLAMTESDTRAELARRGMEAVVVPVAAPAGLGLDALLQAITDMVAGARVRDLGRPRLPVDRAFGQKGFGTVVTGSLVEGALRAGQELELVPGGAATVRVRGLQRHGVAVDEAPPGSRVAVNLQGVEPGEVRRGQVLAHPGTLRATDLVDARVRVLAGAPPLRHNDRVAVHSGTAQGIARVVTLGSAQVGPGEEGWVQLRLQSPVALRDDDRLVLRRLSPAAIVGGGAVADAHPLRHRRADRAAGDSLEARTRDGGRLLEELRKAGAGADPEELGTALALDREDLATGLARLEATGSAVLAGDLAFSTEAWRGLEQQAQTALATFHQDQPLRRGMPREALRTRLRLKPKPFAAAVEALVERGTLAAPTSELLALPGWTPRLTAGENRTVEAALALLAQTPLSPPGEADLTAAGLSPALLGYLEERGDVVRLAPGVVVLATALDEAEARLRAALAGGRAITVSGARDLLGSSRRTVVPLLEYFDRRHVTIRQGDDRYLRD